MTRETLSKARLAPVALAAAVALAALLLLELDAELTFIADDWELLLVREGWSPAVFLDPFNENIVLGPALLFRSLLEVFGMDSALPYYVVSIGLFLSCAVLLFVHLRRRVGEWPALIGAVLLLFLGAAFEDLLWAFQMGYFGSVAAGLGMLIALDRDDARGDRIACGLLTLSLAFSSLGLVFALGALVDVLLGRRRRAGRIYVFAAPLALFVVWWLGWGHQAESHLAADNLVELPVYVFDAAAAGIVSLLGLATDDGSGTAQPNLIWGQLAVPVLVALLGLRIYRERRISRGLAVAIALALAFWVIAGLNRNPERFATSSRYQFPSAVFILLVAGEALRGLRIPRPLLAVAAAGAVLAAIGGYSLLEREQAERWLPVAQQTRASLAAVDLAQPSVQPEYRVEMPPSISVPAGRYLEAAAEHGSPAYDEAALAARPEAERAAADLAMARALGLALTAPPPASPVRCQTVPANAEGASGLTLLGGSFTVTNRSAAPIEFWLGRFATGLSVGFGAIEPGATSAIAIPPDSAAAPWRLGLVGDGVARLCASG